MKGGADPRDQHSFPTRRSSDLGWALRQYAWSNPDKVRRYVRTHEHELSPLSKRNRKSTRLNSSHAVISYAVFCLKKKRHAKGKESVTRRWIECSHSVTEARRLS